MTHVQESKAAPLPCARILRKAPLLPRFFFPLLLGLLLAAGAPPAAAQDAAPLPAAPQGEEENLERVISGFDEEPAPESADADTPPDLQSGFEESREEGQAADEASPGKEEGEQASLFSLDGFVRLDSSYNFAHKAPKGGAPPDGTDYRGLSKLRVALQLELSFDFSEEWKLFLSGQANRDFAYQLNGRDTYTQEVLDQYEQESEFREVYLRVSPGSDLDLKLGRQIVVWGKSDNIRITDVLNPIDNREPGVVDIEDIRLPVTMSRLDYFFGDWSLTAIAVHEVRFNKDPVFGSDFFPLPFRQPPERVPSDGGGNTEYALALSGIFSGYDVAFYWARIFDDAAHVTSPTGSTNPVSCFVPGGCELRHSRLNMLGAAYNIAVGNWLWKTEAAIFEGLEFFSRPGEKFKRLDFLFGFEYTPVPDSVISVEASDRHILNFRGELEQPPDSTPRNINQYVFAYRADMLRQQLHLVALAIFFGREAERGSIRRVSATYDLFDAFSIGGGIVTYHPGNFILDVARNNDRIFFDTKYSF